MAAALLSQHSSNPLDVGSSDALNRAYNLKYKAASRRRIDVDLSSDDPINGYTVQDEVKEYQKHISQVVPEYNTLQQSTVTKRPVYIDLDDDMSDDDDSHANEADDENSHQSCEDQDEEMHDLQDEDQDNDDDDIIDVDDEELTIYQKSAQERSEIMQEIEELIAAVPQLTPDYRIVDRLGTGTFSSVYKAVDLGYHDKWDNTPWQGHHPPTSSAYYQSAPLPRGTKALVAIKRIYVTSSPDRVRNELQIMLECRGCRHVSQLITGYRHEDQVVAIMPYQRNNDFREYYMNLSIPALKSYFRCLFRALRDIHTRGIIHRDVKPANFLFDPTTGVGTLCDFGLASRMELGPLHGACLHTGPTPEFPHGKNKSRNEFDSEEVKRAQKEARWKSSLPSEKVGYPEKDTRPVSKANRAGTRGFRAPEVLFKCGDQTGAIDVWAAGIILLFFLTKKFPLFQSNDDVEALVEIGTIIGRKNMERVATLHSRTFATNVPSINANGISWREFVERLNPELYEPQEPDSRWYPHNNPNQHPDTFSMPPPSTSPSHRASSPLSPPSSPGATPATIPPSPYSPATAAHISQMICALDFLENMMQPESVKRMTPRDALYHPFLAEGPDDEDEDVIPAEDDEFVPHQFGTGVCGALHFRDEVTEEPCVKVVGVCACGNCGGRKYEEVRTLVPGEGIAIGRQPCEFHQGDFEFEDLGE